MATIRALDQSAAVGALTNYTLTTITTTTTARYLHWHKQMLCATVGTGDDDVELHALTTIPGCS